jgi:hypothetical protein
LVDIIPCHIAALLKEAKARSLEAQLQFVVPILGLDVVRNSFVSI